MFVSSVCVGAIPCSPPTTSSLVIRVDCAFAGVVFSKLSQRVDLFRTRCEPGYGGKSPANAAPLVRLATNSTNPYVVTVAAKAAATILRSATAPMRHHAAAV